MGQGTGPWGPSVRGERGELRGGGSGRAKARRIAQWLCAASLLALGGCAVGGTRGVPARPPASAQPGETDALRSARALQARGDHATAASLYEDHLELQPHAAPEIYIAAAREWVAGGKSEEAHELMQRAVAQHPDDPSLRQERARIAMSLGFQRAAERDLEFVTRAWSERATAWAELGLVRMRLDLPCAAQLPLARACALDPDDDASAHLLAQAQLRSGQPVDAARTWKALLEPALRNRASAVPDAWLLEAARVHARADVRSELGADPEPALGWVRLAQRRSPSNAEARYLEGCLLELTGHRDPALQCYVRALDLDPSHLGAMVKLARLYLRCGEQGKANDLARHALALGPDRELRRELERLVAAGPP